MLCSNLAGLESVLDKTCCSSRMHDVHSGLCLGESLLLLSVLLLLLLLLLPPMRMLVALVAVVLSWRGDVIGSRVMTVDFVVTVTSVCC
jgi:hypothetical protein